MALAGAIYGQMVLDLGKWNKSIKKVLKQDLPNLGTGIRRVSSSINQMGNSMTMAGAAIAASMGLGVRSFIKAADTADSFRMRLGVLLGSVEEGNKTFKSMAVLASKVPQQFEEIMRSATALAGIMDDGRKGIEMWMPMLTDLAAAYGLTMEVATGNFIRAYSAGIAASDKFREAGISNMMEFQAGVKYSVEETREMMWKAWAKMGSRFRGTTDELAKIWQGVMSMLKDKWFLFRVAIMGDTEIWRTLKAHVTSLNIALTRNWQELLNWIEVNSDFLMKIALSTISTIAFGVALTTAGLAVKVLAFSLSGLSIMLVGIRTLIRPITLGLMLLTGIVYTLRAAWKQNFMQITTIIKDEGSHILREAQKIGDGIWDAIGGPITALKGPFVDFFDFAWDLVAGLGMVIDKVGIAFWEFADLVVEVITEIVKLITQAVKAAWQNFDLVLDPAHWAKLADDMYSAIEDKFKDTGILTRLFEDIELHWDYILRQKHLENILKGIWDFFTTGWERAGGLAGENQKELWATVAGQIKKDMASVMEAILPGFNEGLDAMIKSYKETYDELMSGIITQTRQMPGLFDPIKAKVDSLKEKIIGMWEGAKPAMLDAIRQAQKYAMYLEQIRAINAAIEAERLRTRTWEEFLGMKTGLANMRTEWETFAEFIEWKMNEIATTIEQSLSSAFQNVIKRQESLKDASKEFLKAIGNQIIKTTSDIVAHEITTLLFAEKTKQAIREEGAQQSILLRWWQSNKEREIEESDLAFKAVMAMKEVAISMWKATREIAIDIWNATAKIWNKFSGTWGGPMLALIETATMKSTIAAAGAGIGAGGIQAMLNGTDFVNQTGPYWLHRGEAVKTRSEVGTEGEEIPIIIQNFNSDASIAVAMASPAGENVIRNMIVKGMAQNDEIRTSIRRYGR